MLDLNARNIIKSYNDLAGSCATAFREEPVKSSIKLSIATSLVCGAYALGSPAVALIAASGLLKAYFKHEIDSTNEDGSARQKKRALDLPASILTATGFALSGPAGLVPAILIGVGITRTNLFLLSNDDCKKTRMSLNWGFWALSMGLLFGASEVGDVLSNFVSGDLAEHLQNIEGPGVITSTCITAAATLKAIGFSFKKEQESLSDKFGLVAHIFNCGIVAGTFNAASKDLEDTLIAVGFSALELVSRYRRIRKNNSKKSDMPTLGRAPAEKILQFS